LKTIIRKINEKISVMSVMCQIGIRITKEFKSVLAVNVIYDDISHKKIILTFFLKVRIVFVPAFTLMINYPHPYPSIHVKRKKIPSSGDINMLMMMMMMMMTYFLVCKNRTCAIEYSN
jgi:hypothetical protein